MGTYNTTKSSNGKVTIKLVENSTSVANNTSNVTVTVQYTSSGQYYLGISSLTIKDNSGATVYSFSRSWGIVSGISKGTVTLDTKTFTAAHSSNGAGSLAISITYRIRTSTNYTETFTDTLSTIPRAAALSLTPSGDLSISSTSGNIGYSFYSYASFYYKLTYKFGNIAQTTITIGNAGAGVTKTGNIKSYTELLAALPNTTSGAFTATLYTYTDNTYGTLVGSNSASKSVSININSIKPSIAWDGNIVPDTTPISGYLIAGYSTAKLQYNTTAASGAGTTTTSFAPSSNITLTSSGSTSLSGSITTNTLPAGGSNYTFSIGASVRDSRGATATITAKTSPTVYGYIAPSISGTFYRTSNSSGTPVADEAGTYVYCSFSSTVGSSINSQNTIQSTTCSYTGSKSGTVTSGGYVSLAESQYLTFTVTATDKVTSSSRVFSVGTATFPLDLYQEGADVGAAIGGVADANKFDVYLPTNISKQTKITETNSNLAPLIVNNNNQGLQALFGDRSAEVPANTSKRIEVATNGGRIDMRAYANGTKGLYDPQNSKWMIYYDTQLRLGASSGNGYLNPTTWVVGNGATTESITVWIGNNNATTTHTTGGSALRLVNAKAQPIFTLSSDGVWGLFDNTPTNSTHSTTQDYKYLIGKDGVTKMPFMNISKTANYTNADDVMPPDGAYYHGAMTIGRLDSAATNLPEATASWLLTYRHNSSTARQFAFPFGLNTRVYSRSYYNNAWGDWSLIAGTKAEVTGVITRTGGTSGSTCNYAAVRQDGRTITLYAKFTSTSSTSAGSNIFEGTLSSAYRPPYDVEGYAYYGSYPIGLRIQPSGVVTVRRGGSAGNISDSVFFSVTYII